MYDRVEQEALEDGGVAKLGRAEGGGRAQRVRRRAVLDVDAEVAKGDLHEEPTRGVGCTDAKVMGETMSYVVRYPYINF